MFTQITAFTLLALSAAVTAAPTAPPPAGPEIAYFALHPDAQCSVLASGYPGSLNSSICYNLPGGVASTELYMVASDYGTVYVYPTADCCDEDNAQVLDLRYQGCNRLSSTGFSVKYDRFA